MSTARASTPFVRTFQVTAAGAGEALDIVVQIGIPERDPLPGGDFRVLAEIIGFDQAYSRYCHGVDALQAFLAACSIVPRALMMLAPAGAKLTWLGGDDLGFETLAAS